MAACGGATLDNIDPATGAVIGTLPASDGADVDAAVAAASRAFPAWSRMAARERAAHLRRIAELIERDVEALARAESIDTGKPISLARAMDIPRAAANFRFFAELCETIASRGAEVFQTEAPMPAPPGSAAGSQGAGMIAGRAVNTVHRGALGVVGLISPWNLPLYLLSWKIAPALAFGNVCVCKPSELTPTTAFLLSKLGIEAGLPAGVLNIVHGLGTACGAAIVSHPLVKAVSFTGGTATGAAIAASAAPMFKKLSLELGGKNASVVLDDVDVEWAAAQAARAGFSNQGQICLCGSRVLVHRRVYEPFVRAFVDRVAALKCGDPLEPSTQQGALISEAHMRKVLSYVELAKAEGGRVLCGGSRVEAGELPERCRGGFFVRPTVVEGLTATARTQREEVFGPLVTVSTFDDDDDAVRLANDSSYGLSASVWSGDGERGARVAERLEVGTAWVNCWLLRDLRVPFGGMKNSGVGREGGEEAWRFFTEARVMVVAAREQQISRSAKQQS
ncbi:MAG: aldehyde dehydrogenase [Phycisphaerales bacterium]